MHRAFGSCTPSHLEESSCSFKPEGPKLAAEDLMEFRSVSVAVTANASNVKLSGSTAGGGHIFSNLSQKQTNVSVEIFSSSYNHGVNIYIWLNY